MIIQKPSEREISLECDPKTELFIQLLDEHDRQIFSYIFAMVVNWDDAQEIMQRVRLRLWQQFDRYDEAKPFGAWARAVAYYLILAFRKERSRQKVYFSLEILESVSQTLEEDSESIFNTRRDALVKCLQKLGKDQRQLVDVYYGRVKSIGELASERGVEPGALRQMVFRIRKSLRACADRSLRQLEGQG